MAGIHLVLFGQLPAVWTALAEAVSGFFIVYFLALNLLYIVFIVIGLLQLRRFAHYTSQAVHAALFRTTLARPVSILVPAYNEERHILEAVQSLLALQYPQHEIIVVDDGSTDGTFPLLARTYELEERTRTYRRQLECEPVQGVYESRIYPNLVVVRKVNGGKSDALNCGINISRYPYYCVLDADSVLEPDALLRLMRPFIEEPDTTVAVGGIVRVANGCIVEHGQMTEARLPRNWLARVQAVEYLQAFLSTRIAFSRLGAVLLISGAFSLFRKSTVIEAGGYNTNTIGEDMELVVRINRLLRGTRRAYRMCYVPDPVCWTEVPSDFASLARQRKRWQKGLIDSIRFNSEMLFNPAYGRLGMFAMPFYLIFELLGPIIELAGYVLLAVFSVTGLLSLEWLLLFLMLAVALGTVITIGAVLLEELSFRRYRRMRDLLGLLLAGAAYNLGFRQLNAIWRTVALAEYLAGTRLWGRIHRVGYAKRKERAA